MLFDDFLLEIPKILVTELPSLSAHLKMAPAERIQSLQNDYYLKFSPRNSAVLILFYPKNHKTHFVLIHRNTYTGVHSAQISFPGGKQERGETLPQTAVREAEEEIGINSVEIEILMPFTKLYIPPSNFLVYPFLGIIKQHPLFIPNPAEVENILEVPLESLLNDNSVVNTLVNASYRDNITVPGFILENYIVWGATAMILSELKEVIKKALS
jgi:8-oxo-dGTP pyrophosphatase MutT (NUDIX family)